jgi:hypothetical protein
MGFLQCKLVQYMVTFLKIQLFLHDLETIFFYMKLQENYNFKQTSR